MVPLKKFSSVSKGCFTWSSVQSVLHSDDVRSGNSLNTTIVPAQKVYNYRSDRSIALKNFTGFSGGCFTWSSLKSDFNANDVRSVHCTDTIKVPAQKVHNNRSNRRIAPKCFSGVFRGCFTWSSVESIIHYDDVR